MFTELWGWQQDLAVAVRDADAARRRGARASIASAWPRSSPRPARRAARSSPSRSPRRSSPPTASPSPRRASRATEDEAVAAAEAIGYPVVLKLFSHTITHKTDVGGVKLNLRDAAAVREAWESIRAAVARPAGCRALRGRHRPADDRLGRLRAHRGQLHRRPVRAGAAVRAGRPAGRGLPRPRPGPAAPDHHAGAPDDRAHPHLRGAARCPRARCGGPRRRWSSCWCASASSSWSSRRSRTSTSTRCSSRPTGCWRSTRGSSCSPPDARRRPAATGDPTLPAPVQRHLDRPRRVRPVPSGPSGRRTRRCWSEFHRTLSEQSIYQRYFENLGLDQRIAHERLIRVCFSDYDRELALVAEVTDAAGRAGHRRGRPAVQAARRRQRRSSRSWSATSYQGRGLGSELLTRLVDVARREGLARILADILATNGPMIRLARGRGFTIEGELDEGVVHARLELDPA